MNQWASLTSFEIKKLFCNRFLFAVVVFMLIINCIFIYRTHTTYSDPVNKQAADAEWEIYKTIEGEITEEKIKSLENYRARLEMHAVAQEEFYYSEFWDLTVIRNLLTKIEAAKHYEAVNEKRLTDNAVLKQWYVLSGNRYSERQADLIARLYADRSVSAYYDTTAFQKYFSYSFSSLLLLLISFFASSALFAKEKEVGMSGLLQSTPLGRKTLTRAKVCALTVFVTIIFCVFTVSDLLMFSWRERFAGACNPIYSIEEFANSPLSVSVAGFVLISALVKLLGIVIFSVLSCVFSSVLNKSYFVLLTDILLLITLMITSSYAGSVFDILNLLNPVRLLINRTAFRSFSTINLFHFPIPVFIAMLVCNICVLCILLTVIGKVNSLKGARHVTD